MKFTLSWLKDHLETDASLETIVEKLSLIGLEVEGVEDPAAKLAPFTVARVLSAEQHPNADRLKVCQVETADHGTVQVVCGAPNARSGMIGVFAPSGSWIPGTEMELKPGKIRGAESNGMLVSEREMGLSDEHAGIIDLTPADGEAAPAVGMPLADLLGLNDPVVEIAITPNRGDCLGVRGVARDLAAAGLGQLKPLQAPKVAGSYDSPMSWQIDPDATSACPFVAGRHFRGLTNGPAPAWMQRRLTAIGLRPISALVDITNYVTYDLGRPLHVFDAAKVSGNPTMRFARRGEEILALDGKTYGLDETMLIIDGGDAPEGIGGIMGGEESGCTGETREVFLEVALFDPVSVAMTGRKLGIHSDARYRFERKLDPESAVWGVEVASRLIAELCGGEASRAVSAGKRPDPRQRIALRKTRCETLGGLAVEGERQQRILESLGCDIGDAGETLQVTTPTWRPDLEGEACLVEEVLRIVGYDQLPITPLELDTTLPLPALSQRQRRVAAARTALAWRGLEEAVTFSFLSAKQAVLFGWTDAQLRLLNPISSELDIMRPSVLPTLVEAGVRNSDRGFPDVGLFEVGPQYDDNTPEGQTLVAAGLRSGQAQARHWAIEARALDTFDAKADALAVLEAAGAPVENLQTTADAPAWYHPGRSGRLRLGPNVLAAFGELHPRVLQAFDLKGPVAAFEIFLERIPEPKRKDAGKTRPALILSPFQPVERDFAFLVAEEVPGEKLLRAAKGADKQLVTAARIFDVYRGQGVPDGQKSIALAITLQPTERTLTDDDLEAVAKKIVAAVEKQTGGSLRG
ncbi:phenylalanine--tRNA ligase subunit beta [Algihabitans albus]|uniref:phenylalanine--tRNA ligase subunit beta n=1 Tax=Algihabitans albus TaxID=2164067 RepID=UPI000E5CC80F|nr:phenylalanine--tRNA ligase subunit beta [Algihabitans albus]